MSTQKNSPAPAKTEHPKATMSSIEIAEVSGKLHKHVLDSIRKMEPEWEKVAGTKFRPSEYSDKSGRKLPMYELDKRECLYIATKFNDEARARLIVRWYELEQNSQKPRELSRHAGKVENMVYPCKMGKKMTDCYFTGGQVYTRFGLLISYLNNSGFSKDLREKLGASNFITVPINKQQIWFGNLQAFLNYISTAKTKPDYKISNEVAMDIWGFNLFEASHPGAEYTHHFTLQEVMVIINEVTQFKGNPKRVQDVIEMIMQGGGRS